jgi:uncharacterized protein (DUF427 family)
MERRSGRFRRVNSESQPHLAAVYSEIEDKDTMANEELIRFESVWDYPRPPRLESTTRHLRVVHAAIVLAQTCRGLRVLETSHPPVYYFAPSDVRMQWLQASASRGTFCEFKGVASYWDLIPGSGEEIRSVAWSYARPSHSYIALKDHLAFYPGMVDECWVDEERVVPQPGDFYGGWITSDIKGPFKGTPGTLAW